jgi:hypothetical protein
MEELLKEKSRQLGKDEGSNYYLEIDESVVICI